MEKHYLWLLFDADDTLFDYRKAEESALQKAFERSGLGFEPGYLPAYQRINQELWKQRELGQITPAVLQVRRFEQLFASLGIDASAERFNPVYLDLLAESSQLMDGAEEVVRALHAHYHQAIVTNGLTRVQRGRLAISPIRDRIDVIVISEEVQAAKPEGAFFDAAFKLMGNPSRNAVLIIGDSLTADIQGGVSYGIDTCWFNPRGLDRPVDLPITYEIRSLRELPGLLEGEGLH